MQIWILRGVVVVVRREDRDGEADRYFVLDLGREGVLLVRGCERYKGGMEI